MTFLTRYHPANANGHFVNIDRVLDSFFGDTLPRATESPRFAVDVLEAGDAYLIHAELPGVKKEQVNVDIDGAVVTITAEWNQEKPANTEAPALNMLRSERRLGQGQGKLARSFQLPAEVDSAHASARMVDGILELRLPKQTQATAKRLTVQ
jgi:HSP20 family protein